MECFGSERATPHCRLSESRSRPHAAGSLGSGRGSLCARPGCSSISAHGNGEPSWRRSLLTRPVRAALDFGSTNPANPASPRASQFPAGPLAGAPTYLAPPGHLSGADPPGVHPGAEGPRNSFNQRASVHPPFVPTLGGSRHRCQPAAPRLNLNSTKGPAGRLPATSPRYRRRPTLWTVSNSPFAVL